MYKFVRNALGDAYRMELVDALAVRRAVRGTMKAALMSRPPLTNEAPTSRLLVRALFVAVSTSALGGTRTPNLLIRSQMLYPLSYERTLCSIPRPAPWLRPVQAVRTCAQRD